ncbi:hypothetical protein [Paenibacillus sp. HJGM_3]|uniref:hypothetical protein n=1 Tax=Paenibacillus sp. HJGM_3 TaxID=3379816 RepID=UPI00385DDD99
MEDRGTLIYRCRNCGDKFGPVSYPDATTIAIESARDEKNLLSIHHCKNGYIGIADLIAIEPTDKAKHKHLARLS